MKTKFLLAFLAGGLLANITSWINWSVADHSQVPVVFSSSPVFNLPSDTTVYVGDELKYLVSPFDDQDHSYVNFEVTGLPAWSTLRPINLRAEAFLGRPDLPMNYGEDNEYSLRTVTVVVKDGDDLIFNANGTTVARMNPSGEVQHITGGFSGRSVDGSWAEADFKSIADLAVDDEGNIYVLDNIHLRKISVDGMVTTLPSVGDRPYAIDISSDGNLLYVLVIGELRAINLTTMEVEVVDLPEVQNLTAASEILIRNNGNLLVHADFHLYEYNPAGELVLVYGNGFSGTQDGIRVSANIQMLMTLAEDDFGNLYFMDTQYRILRRIDAITKDFTTIGGKRNGARYTVGYDSDLLEFSGAGNMIYKDGALLFPSHGVIRRLTLNEYLIEGVPDADDMAESTVEFTATDSDGNAVTKQMRLAVEANDRPQISEPHKNIIAFSEADELTLPVMNADETGSDVLEVVIKKTKGTDLQLGTSPTDLFTYDEVAGQWSFTTTVAEFNSTFSGWKGFSDNWQHETLDVAVSFESGNAVFERSINIWVKPENNAPDMEIVTSHQLRAGETFSLDFSPTDTNGDAVHVSLTNAPDWLVQDSVALVQRFFDPGFDPDLPSELLDSLRILPRRAAMNSRGELFIASGEKEVIYKVLANDQLELYAGTGEFGFQDGPRLSAQFGSVDDILFDEEDNMIFIDRANYRIRKIDDDTGDVTTIVGNGSSTPAEGGALSVGMSVPLFLAFDNMGNLLIGYPHYVAKVNEDNNVERLIGSFTQSGNVNGDRDVARLSAIKGVVQAPDGTIYLWDENSNTYKQLSEGILSPVDDLPPTIENQRFFTSNNINTVSEWSDGKIYYANNYAYMVYDVLRQRMIELGAGFGRGNAYGKADQVSYGRIWDLHGTSDGGVFISQFDSHVDAVKLLKYSTTSIEGRPLTPDVGTHTFTVTLNDARGGVVEKQITVEVLPAENDAPQAAEVDDITTVFEPNKPLQIALFDFVSDTESADNELTYEVTGNSDETSVATAAISSADGLLDLTVLNAGTAVIEVTVADVLEATATISISVEVTKAEAEISISSEPVMEDGTGKSVSITTNPEDLNYTVTYNGSEDLPVAEGTYQVVATIDDRNYQGVAQGELEILPGNEAPTAIEVEDIQLTFGDQNTLEIDLFEIFSDEETADADLVLEVISNTDETTVNSQGIEDNGTFTLQVNNAGTSDLVLRATDEGQQAVDVEIKVVVGQATATIAFGDIEFIGDGEEKAVTVTTTPADLNFNITYDDAEEVPSAIGDYAVEVVIDERNYKGTASTTLSIINVAPEDLRIDGAGLFENQDIGAEVGTLVVTDKNPNDTHQLSLPDGMSNNDVFSLNGDKLLTNAVFDFEEKSDYEVTILIEDSQGATLQKVLTVNVIDINDAPELGSYPDIQIVKDLGQLSFQVTGLSNGGDAGQSFTISAAATGVVAAGPIAIPNSGNESITVNFQTITGQEGNGTIKITVKDNGGTANGGIDSFTRVVNVNVLPANISTAGDAVCGPGEVTLTATGADDYAWYDEPLEGIAIETGNSYTQTVSTGVTFYVAGIFSGLESALRVPVSAEVFDQPVAPVISNNNGNLSVPEQSGISYQWLLNGEVIEDATSSFYTPLVNGDYSISIANANGCTALSDVITVLVTSVERPVGEPEVQLHPNPTSDYVELDFGRVLNEGTLIRLLDTSGKELSQVVLKQAANKARLNVAEISQGTHIVLIQDGQHLMRKRLIIKR